MKSSEIIPFHAYDNEITQLYQKIASYIATLDESINDEEDSLIVLQYKIDRWKDKKAVLEIALLCLSGDKLLTDLHLAMKDPSYSRWNEKDGWWECKTEIFVNKTIMQLAKTTLARLPFISTDTVINNKETIHLTKSVSTTSLLPCVRDYINLLPEDIQLLLLIGHLHRPADLINFSMTSKNNWEFFQTKGCMKYLPSLLYHVAIGEYDNTENIYSNHHILLTKKANPCDQNFNLDRYRYNNLTPFQIALKNEEFEEAEKMQRYLSLEEIQKQIFEIFPSLKYIRSNCYSDLRPYHKIIGYGSNFEKIKSLLKDLYNAIVIDTIIDKDEDGIGLMSEKTIEVRQQLHDAINPEKYDPYQRGLVFDVRIYLEALRYFKDFKFTPSSSYGKGVFWCVQVEKLIASYLPTVYLRAAPYPIFLENKNSFFEINKRAIEPPSMPDLNNLSERHLLVESLRGKHDSWLIAVTHKETLQYFESYVNQHQKIGQNFYVQFFNAITSARLTR